MVDPLSFWLAVLLVPVGVVPLVYLAQSMGWRSVGAVPIIALTWVHVLAGALRYNLFGLWAPDAQGYDRLAMEAAEAIGGDSQFTFTEGKQGWPLLLGAIYRLIGHNPLFGIVLASATVVMTAWVIAEATVLHSGPRAGRIAFYLIAVGPLFFLWGDSLLRESAVWFCIAITLLGRNMVAFSRQRATGLAVVCVGIAALMTVRGTLAAILVLALALSWAATSANSAGRLGKPAAVGLMISIVAAGPIAISYAATHFGYDLGSINESREALARTATTSFGTVTGTPRFLTSPTLRSPPSRERPSAPSPGS